MGSCGRLGHVLDGQKTIDLPYIFIMTTALAGVITSPVQMEDRKALGLKAGDTVKVHQKIVDKGKTRIQIFEGLVLARKHGDEAGATFTVRKVSSGIGVEKIYPLYSPLIEQIEIVKRAKVRRAKLYYIREKVAREIKRQMRRMSLVSLSTESETDANARIDAEAKTIAETTAAVEAAVLKEQEMAAAALVAVDATPEVVVEEPVTEVSVEAEVVEPPTAEAPVTDEEKAA
jgi:large subunit ribosomal protein L19